MPMSPHAHSLRKGRVSEAGRVYLVTSTTRKREPLFADLWLARAAIGVLRDCERDGSASTLAFMLMPDHLHWLVQLHCSRLSTVVGRYKAHSAAAINVRRGTPGLVVWQKGLHDHALRTEADLPAVARYVVANPVRAGLVQSVRAYSHWDAVWL